MFYVVAVYRTAEVPIARNLTCIVLRPWRDLAGQLNVRNIGTPCITERSDCEALDH